jgi:hypothetical protein
MPAQIIRTDPTTHPTFRREQRRITAILVTILVRGGRSESEAIKEAEAMLAPLPPERETSRRALRSKWAKGA